VRPSKYGESAASFVLTRGVLISGIRVKPSIESLVPGIGIQIKCLGELMNEFRYLGDDIHGIKLEETYVTAVSSECERVRPLVLHNLGISRSYTTVGYDSYY
jgi:hypothetical protein